MKNPPNKPPKVTSLSEAKRVRANKQARESSNSMEKLSAELDHRTEVIVTKMDDLEGRIDNLERNVQAILDILVKLKSEGKEPIS